MGLLSLAKSRKFWLTVISIIVVASGGKIGLTDIQMSIIAGALAFLCFTIAHEDRAKIWKSLLDTIEVKLPEDGQPKEYSFKVDFGKVLKDENPVEGNKNEKPLAGV